MIKAVITDFDGTLVDTFKANFYAYQEAFRRNNLLLQEEEYLKCFGFRFDAFMREMNINDLLIIESIREIKKEIYPLYFDYLSPNKVLIDIINSFHTSGIKTAIASTARRENLLNAVNNLQLNSLFDTIYAGIDVKNGKPDPEIYIKTMEELNVNPDEVLIFEDSDVGIKAAKSSGAKYVRVTKEWFE